MLDLIFLILMIIVLIKAFKGDFCETLCNVAMVIGIIASVIGMIICFAADTTFLDMFAPAEMGILNLLVFVVAVLLKPAARLLVKTRQDKIDEACRTYYNDVERFHENLNRPVYNPTDATDGISDILDENGCIDIHKARKTDAPSTNQPQTTQTTTDLISDRKP